jgi:uncharacterized membrane protein YfcA
MTLTAVAAGLLIGLSLGALGGGGSILTVPALVYLLGQSPHQAVTASLLVVGIAAATGAIAHARAGRVRLRSGAVFGGLGIVGSYAGSLASGAVPAQLLLAGFGLVMLAAAALMIVRRRDPGQARRSGHDGSGTGRIGSGTGRIGSGTGRIGSGRRAVIVTAAATGVGLITGFFGVGGGFAVVPALVLVLRFEMPTAAGTSLVVIAINSAVALAARVGFGGLALDWPLIGTFTGAAMIGALAGARVAGRADPQRLAVAFAVLIVIVAGYTLARSLSGLA